MKNEGSNPLAAENGLFAGMAKCMTCGYPVHGLDPTGRCPECGAPVVDSIQTDTGTRAEAELIQQAMRYLGSGWLVLALTLLMCLSKVVAVVIMLVAVGFRLYGLTRLRSLNRSAEPTASPRSSGWMSVTLTLSWSTLGALTLCLIINRLLALSQQTTPAFDESTYWVGSGLLTLICLEAGGWMMWLRREARERGFPKIVSLTTVMATICMIPILLVACLVFSLLLQLIFMSQIVIILGVLSFPLVGFCCWSVTMIFKDMHHQSMDHAEDLGNGDEILTTKLDNAINLTPRLEELPEIPLAELEEDRDSDTD